MFPAATSMSTTRESKSAALSGSYSLSSNGYVTGTWNVNNASLPFGLYLFSPTQGYYVDERTNAVGGGNIYAQSGSVTTNAAWAGSFATKQFGYFSWRMAVNNNNASGVSGQISADGNGLWLARWTSTIPAASRSEQTLQGTYSVGTRRSGTHDVDHSRHPVEGTRSYTGYIVDSGRVLLLETDNNLVSGGDAIRQF